MFLPRSLPVVFALATLLPLASCTPKLDASFKPPANQPRSYRVDAEQTVTSSLLGAEMVQKTRPQFDLSLLPTATDDAGAVTLRMTYDKVGLEQSNTVAGVSLDIGKLAGGDLPGEVADAVQGESLTARIGPKGEVLEVSGADEIARKVREAVSGQLQQGDRASDPRMQGLGKMLEQDDSLSGSFSEDQAKALLAGMFDFYPPAPLKAGETWTETGTLPGPGSPLADKKFTVVSIDGDRATVKFDHVIKPNPDAPPMSMGPLRGRVSLSGQASGTAELDRDTGWLQRLEEQGEVSGQMKMEGGAMMPGTLTIPVKRQWRATVAAQ